MNTIELTINPNRNLSGVKPCRDIVAKNFSKYTIDDLFELDRLSCGVLIRQAENDDYVLFKNSCGCDMQWWLVMNKKTKKICLELEIVNEEGNSVLLEDDKIILTLVLPDYWRYGEKINKNDVLNKETITTYVKNINADFKIIAIQKFPGSAPFKTYSQPKGFVYITDNSQFHNIYAQIQ